MNGQRMSPFTALFLSIGGIVITAIIATCLLAMYGIRTADHNIATGLRAVDQLTGRIPEIVAEVRPTIDAIAPRLAEQLNFERRPDYAGKIAATATFVASEWTDRMRPSLMITNTGDETVSLLAVRVAALDAAGNAIADWTQVVATPIAVDGDWRGPLLPGSTRHVVVSDGYRLPATALRDVQALVEIADVQVWQSAGTIATQEPR